MEAVKGTKAGMAETPWGSSCFGTHAELWVNSVTQNCWIVAELPKGKNSAKNWTTSGLRKPYLSLVTDEVCSITQLNVQEIIDLSSNPNFGQQLVCKPAWTPPFPREISYAFSSTGTLFWVPPESVTLNCSSKNPYRLPFCLLLQFMLLSDTERGLDTQRKY